MDSIGKNIYTKSFHLQEVHVIFRFHIGIGNTFAMSLLLYTERTQAKYSMGLSSLSLSLALTGTRSSHKYIIINYNETTLCEKLNCF